MPRNIQLFVIDAQRSFCAVVDPAFQQTQHDGELCIPGAWDDMVRLAALVKRIGGKLTDITVTLDSHHQFHVAHPIYWRSVRTNFPPAPFTVLREHHGIVHGCSCLDETDLGEFRTVRHGYMKRAVDYLRALDAGHRYPHIIWPPHGLIGTPGHNIVAPLAEALFAWERDNITHGRGMFCKVIKGSNPHVEHFSAVRAEVIDPSDITTQLNTELIAALMAGDEILLAGEPLSHALANTVRDIAQVNNAFIRKCVLLRDATSNVPYTEVMGDNFIKEMTRCGMKVTTTKDYMA